MLAPWLHGSLPRSSKPSSRRRSSRAFDPEEIEGLLDELGNSFYASAGGERFLCPLTHTPLSDPVLAADGVVYGRRAIQGWIAWHTTNGGSAHEEQHRDDAPPPAAPPPPVLVPSPLHHMPMSTELGEAKATRAELQAFLEDLLSAEAAQYTHAELAEEAELEGANTTAASRPTATGGGAVRPSLGRIEELSRAFEELDGMRDVLRASLDGWRPPLLVCLGGVRSGSSSVLERLVMRPLLPRAPRSADAPPSPTTRLAVLVRLRRAPREAAGAWLSVARVAREDGGGDGGDDCFDGAWVVAPHPVPAERAHEYVQRQAAALLAEAAEGAAVAVESSHVLIVEVRHPDVPTIDLLDAPPTHREATHREAGEEERSDKPAADAVATAAPVVSRLLSHRREASLCIVAVRAAAAVASSGDDAAATDDAAVVYVREQGLEERALGVLSFCDDARSADAPWLQAWLSGAAVGASADAHEAAPAPLDPWYGWVATMNAPVDAEGGGKDVVNGAEGGDGVAAATTASHGGESLRRQAEAERAFFGAGFWPALDASCAAMANLAPTPQRDGAGADAEADADSASRRRYPPSSSASSRLGTSALSRRLNGWYLGQLRRSWAPRTFDLLDRHASAARFGWALLGAPPQPLRGPRLDAAAAAAVRARLSLPRLTRVYRAAVTSLLSPLRDAVAATVDGASSARVEAAALPAWIGRAAERQHDIASAVAACLTQLRAAWRDAATALLTAPARASWQDATAVVVAEEANGGGGGGGDDEAPGRVYSIDVDFAAAGVAALANDAGAPCEAAVATLTLARGGSPTECIAEAVAAPPFALARFPRYVDAVVARLEALLLESEDNAKAALQPQLQQLFSVNSSTWARWTLADDCSWAAVRCDGVGFADQLLVALLHQLPSVEAIHAAAACLSVGDEEEACAAEREALEARLEALEGARSGIVAALGFVDPM